MGIGNKKGELHLFQNATKKIIIPLIESYAFNRDVKLNT